MPAYVDARPGGLNVSLRPGNTFVVTLNWPAGMLTGRTFTSTLDGTALTGANGSLSVVGDIMTVTVSEAFTATLVGAAEWLLTETTGGETNDVLMGKWTPSDNPGSGTAVTAEVTEAGVVVEVTVHGVSSTGDLTVGGDLTMVPATISAGVADGGVIRRTHSIQVPWAYTQSVNPTDKALGTALLVDAQVTLTGPTNDAVLQTGYFGPRGIIDIEGLTRWATNMTAIAFAPVGYYDALTIANDAGVARNLSPSWSFLSARSVIADGANCTLVTTDVNRGGAAFVDSAVWGSVDSGQLNGTTNTMELVSFLSMPGLFGNTQLTRRVAFDAMAAYPGIHPGIPNPTGPHWSGAGNFDTTAVTLSEEIGLRVQKMSLGTTKIGVATAHPIRLMAEDLTHAGALAMIDVGSARVFTMTGSGQVRALELASTFVFEDDSSIFDAGLCFHAHPVLKNATGEAHSLGVLFGWVTLNSAPTFRGDAAALSSVGHIGFRDLPELAIVSGGTVALTNVTTVDSGANIGSGGTVTTRKALNVADATGSGTLTTQIGVDIAALVKGGTNIGIRNASTEVDTPATQNITAVGNTITANAKVKELTASANFTLNSAPTIADGQNGQIIELINVDTTDTITLQDQGTLANSNLRLVAASIALGPRDTVRLRFSSAVGDWVQVTPVVNVL